MRETAGWVSLLRGLFNFVFYWPARHDFINGKRIGIRVEVSRNVRGLASVGQPDERDIVVLDEPAGACRTIVAGVVDDDSDRIIVVEPENQVRKMARLVGLPRVDRRLTVLGGDNE